MHRLPAYCRHSTGQALVRIAGRTYYLGLHGTAQSHERYRQLVASWVAAGMPKNWRHGFQPGSVSMSALADAYLQHADVYYRRTDGRRTSEFAVVRAALGYALRLFGSARASEFGPDAIRAVRDAMIAAGCARKTVNGYVQRIHRMFRWAAAQNLLGGANWQALLAVPALRPGRSLAPERKRVRPPPLEDVRKVQRVVLPMPAAMIELQLLTGMRPGELCAMRVDEVDTASEPWTFRPRHHKTAHLDFPREVAIGPQAREILGGWLRIAQIRAGRQARVFEIQVTGYRQNVLRGCARAGVKRFVPHQLRHLAATRLRAEIGLDATRAVLGHTSVETTAIYAEQDRSTVRRAMERLG